MVELGGGDVVTIGRRPDNTVQLVETSVSGHHAELRATAATTGGGDRAWVCRDLASANGTLVNGVAVPPAAAGDGIPLRDGDRLTLGRVIGRYDAAPPLPADAENPACGVLINGVYRLAAELGEGPGYVAFRGHDELRERPVSLRIFRSPPGGDAVFLAELERAARRAQEATAAAHPNLVSIVDVQRWLDTALVMVSEWVEGISLLDVLRRRRVLSVPEALRLLADATAASEHTALALDFHPRPVLLASAESPPATAAEIHARTAEPLGRWPAFAAKFNVLLTREPAPGEEDGHPISLPPVSVPRQAAVAPLAAFFCELLGRPIDAGDRAARIVDPALGEAGNAVLHRALHPRAGEEGFESGRGFLDALQRSQSPV